MKRRWVIPVVAVVLALATTAAVVSYLQGLRNQAAAVQPAEKEAVVFAKATIGERKIVRGDALEIRQIPVEAIHPQAARRIEDVVNRVAVAPIFLDEQVLSIKLAPVGVNVGLAYALPKDKRAMTIAVNEVIGVAGFVFPGDRVDVVTTVVLDDVSHTKIVLQDVEVLAIAQKVEQKPGEEPRVTTSATLALTPEQSEVLAQVDNSGKVRLALRPYGVTERTQTTGTTAEAVINGKKPRPAAVAQPAAPVQTSAARSRTAARPRKATVAASTTPPPAVRVYNVELWRATERQIVRLEEERK